MFTFADLKAHRYYYWCCFPALVAEPAFAALAPPQALGEAFDAQTARAMEALCEEPAEGPAEPCFLLQRTEDGASARRLPLTAWSDMDVETRGRTVVACLDPCPLPHHPGWPLRNWLLLLRDALDLQRADVLCFRPRGEGARACAGSVLLRAHLGERLAGEAATGTSGAAGWEPNPQGRMLPRLVRLHTHLQPEHLAAASADLNLRLMRWRLLPQLDTEALSRARCLLVGAGTLGCAVARCLLGWGVRSITLLDSGRVAYSNPVRQWLFELSDCADGGKPKAEAAAAALLRILPTAAVRGITLSVPMPGHPASSAAELEAVKAATRELEEQVRAHDVIFLLTDTRESRWLPTLLASVHDKLVVNVALGFDTYLVMRHGHGALAHADAAAAPAAAAAAAAADGMGAAALANEGRLGCYFCNEIVAPSNSTRQRTLDQQCTVTRPGLAPVAAALGTELLVALLHHPLRQRAPADTQAGAGGEGPDGRVAAAASAAPTTAPAANPLSRPKQSPLGILPHQIRGFVAYHHTMLPCTPAFAQCVACSEAAARAYAEHGADWVVSICNDPEALERLTGLDKLHAETGEVELDVEWDEEEEEEEADAEGE